MATRSDVLWNSQAYWSEPAEQAFAKARRRAVREVLRCRLLGRRSTLAAFDEVREERELLPESREELHPVSLADIVGSVGKHRSFTPSFRPRSRALLPRWKRAFTVTRGFRGHRPVELYEVDGRYYVLDGHFRVSVGRALGHETIQARIRRWT